MALYSIGVRTSGAASGTAAWEIRTGAQRIYIMELGLSLAAATASTYGFGRPAAIGVTPTSPVIPPPEDPANGAAVCSSALAWATGPTVPAIFMRRIGLPATIGGGVIWTFPRGVVVAPSSSIVLWNLAANSVVDAYAVIEE